MLVSEKADFYWLAQPWTDVFRALLLMVQHQAGVPTRKDSEGFLVFLLFPENNPKSYAFFKMTTNSAFLPGLQHPLCL